MSYEGPGYVRSLAVLAEAPPVSVRNSFHAIADHDNSIDVSLLDLVVASKRKLRDKEKIKKRFNSSSSNSSSSIHFIYICGSRKVSFHPADDGRRPEIRSRHEYIVNREFDLATTWTKRKAITHYENFHNIIPIETIANSALGIEGWAFHDVGLLEDAGDAG